MSLSPEINHAGDDDSLFGSPPSSPIRGRSPSPLALPSGTAQNVGTLALPGSHLVAELPVTPPASLPLTASVPAPSRQPVPPPHPRIPLQSIGSSSRRNSARPESALRKSRKGKEKERSATPRPTPPPISLPAADEPPPPNFLRNQHALLGLAGMVGGVNPANLPKPRDTRGTTAEDPIVVEEEPSLPQQPSIGKRPVWPGQTDPSQLPRPTSEQILGSLLRQKNVFPVVVSLLRLLAPGAPSLASVPPNYPYYPYPYPYPYQVTPASSAPASWTRSQSPEQASLGGTSAGVSAPPLKRRKLNSVPAGAADWDVPYPFEEGQGPENYRMNWERERSKQLLADLVQLVKGAAQKAATKTWYQQQQSHRRPYGHGVLMGYGPEPTVNKYYRPKTMYYGLERAPVALQRPYHPYPQASFAAPSASYHTSGTSTPSTSMASGTDAGLPHKPRSTSAPVQAQSVPEGLQFSSAAFDQLVESLLSVQQQQEQQVAEPSVGSAPTLAADPATSPTAPSNFTSEDNTQALFDNWLEMLTAFPPGDPNEGAVTSLASPTSPAEVSATSSSMTTTIADPSSQIPDCLIDPALLDLAMSSITEAVPSTSGPSHLSTGPTFASASTTNIQSATPSLVDSPTVTTASLPDPADTGPATPTWDWAFPNGQDAPSETMVDMKALEQWAGMDVDVSAIINEHLSSALPACTTEPSSSAVVSEGSSTAPQLGVETRAEPEPQPHPCVQHGPGLPQDDVLRQGLGAQDASHPTFDQGMVLPAPIPQGSSAQVPPSTALGVLPAPFVSSVAHAMATSARAKGKAKAVPGTGNGIGVGGTAAVGGKLDRKAILERARRMRASLVAEVERAKVALWETTLEQGVLVGFGRELEKETRSRAK